MQLATEEPLVAAASSTSTPAKSHSCAILRTPEELTNIVSSFALSDEWIDRVRLRTEHRWYERLYHGPDHDIWAISWLPGQSTGFHDHGESSGAFVVAMGILEEHRAGEQPLVIHPGEPRAFGRDYAHDVRNNSFAPAISIHAYSPPLTDMNEYELEGNQLVPREGLSERAEALHQEWHMRTDNRKSKPSAFSIEQMLATARSRLRRLSPDEAYRVAAEGAILVDIRPEGQRAIEGNIPGALIIERNVLEWRFDPTSSARLPVATNHDLRVIVFCSEGYTSSLAAAALQYLGLWRATDIAGGFHAWRAAGLPIVP
ncbi:rhodanese-like domain-containing protein [Terriglobus sp. YAF25]|uniref:rhodanese-like domain-containing protein n=1 Tax=Terriglobus sp. YAF25 TaxID=3233080 RepID=UPI003F97D851